MSIVWNETLEVGDAAIDADHRRMIDLIAILEAAASGPGQGGHVGRTLAELAQLTAEHFAREEALQDRIGFPDRHAHRASHEMLLKRLDSVMAHYSIGSDDVRAGIIRTLGDSLATWLVTHITNSDMEFKPYMSGSP
jgi:hemerythrin